MTKVATIDKRRFVHVLVIAAMMLTTLLAALIPTVVLADNPADNEGITNGSFETDDSSSPPAVNEVALTATDNNTADAMDPTVEYWLHVKVTDNQTLEHLNWIEVTIFYDSDGLDPAAPSTVDNQTCAIITWTPADTWTMTDMGTGSTWSYDNGTTPELTNNTGWFIFPFTPGKVATENTGSANWDIYAYAHDEAGGDGDAFLRDLDMNWYGEINTVSPSVDFGSVALGAESESIALHATYICNGDYRQQAKTDAAWWTTDNYSVSLETAETPGEGEFTLWISEDGNSSKDLQLSGTYQTVDSEAITTEDGNLQDEIVLWLRLGSSGVASGIYEGDIYFLINTPS